MKTLQLDKPILNFKGETIPSGEGIMALRDLYLHYLGVYTSNNGKSVICAYKLGLAIAGCKESKVEIENADFVLLKEATQKSQHGALIMGQLYEELERIEKAKKETPND